jgi:hypothetical protein
MLSADSLRFDRGFTIVCFATDVVVSATTDILKRLRPVTIHAGAGRGCTDQVARRAQRIS